MEHGTQHQMRIQALVDQQKLLQKQESDLRQIQQKQQTNMELLLKELYSNEGPNKPQTSLLPSLAAATENDEILSMLHQLNISRSEFTPSIEPPNQPNDSLPSPSQNGSAQALESRTPTSLKEDEEPKDKADSLTQVTARKRKRDAELTESTAHKIPRKRTIQPKTGSSRDETVDENFTIPNKFEGPRQCRYPKISSLEKYTNIVEVDKHVVELHCKFCQGNVVRTGLVNGVPGMQCHIQRGHRRSYNLEWVVQNCVKASLTKTDVEKVKAGKYRMEQLVTRSFDVNGLKNAEQEIRSQAR